MGPAKPLPFGETFQDADSYIDSLLDFVGTNDLLRTLCGGVHILDFFTTQDPDLYTRVLPQEWRDFFVQHDIMDTLDLLMREDIDSTPSNDHEAKWRDGAAAPASLIEYITTVRKHLLIRKPYSSQCARNRAMKPTQKLARHVAVGMNVKKVHEVGLFASYIDRFASDLSNAANAEMSHLVDFGSGQNYLGRALASEPYNRNIVAIESKSHNAERAKEYDIRAKLAEKEKLVRNKKAFRAGLEGPDLVPRKLPPTPPLEPVRDDSIVDANKVANGEVEVPKDGKGTVLYVEHRIQNGELDEVIHRIPVADPRLLVISLHSCGNLVHHGLRSLTLNPAVKAVAMVGCCYNLLTSRLGPATYKLSELRPTTHAHPRLVGKKDEGVEGDPDGFPMSERLTTYGGEGLSLNITARMMAVQAPQNWGAKDSESFFTRHFYRALLQRIFLDRGVVGPPAQECVGNTSPAGHSSGGTPIIIGSLRKSCYDNFVSYVRGALVKLYEDAEICSVMKVKMNTITDTEIEEYERKYRERKKDLSVTWSLMAFSAGVVEATIVVDRYLWLREQDEVAEAWVEPIFDYALSPRNLLVVGIKK